MNWDHELIIEIIKMGLREDLGSGDVTTDSVVPEDHRSDAVISAKAEGVIAGLPLAQRIFHYIDPHVHFEYLRKDGDVVKFGDHLAKISGSTRSILKAERLALNFMQRLSGIATKTAYYKGLIADYPNLRIVDTRKTTPGLRLLEKYAVRVGGGHNHRMGLYDAVLIKDNHIEAAGGVRAAILMARQNIPHTMKIEVEVENLEGVLTAVEAGADIIMLDNMAPEMMKKAVELINGRAITEASGNITDANIRAAAAAGIDVISMGALTYSIKALDLSLNINPKKIEEIESRH